LREVGAPVRVPRTSSAVGIGRTPRVGLALLHGLLLAIITIGSILAGYVVYVRSGLLDQVAIQVLVGGVLCVAAFALLGWFLHRVSAGRFTLIDLRELGVAYVAAFLWSAGVFVPLHYATQGYLTGFGNILGIWLFQLPFNLLSLLVANGRLLAESDRGQVTADE
jgi:hypothetical protein